MKPTEYTSITGKRVMVPPQEDRCAFCDRSRSQVIGGEFEQVQPDGRFCCLECDWAEHG